MTRPAPPGLFEANGVPLPPGFPVCGLRVGPSGGGSDPGRKVGATQDLQPPYDSPPRGPWGYGKRVG